MQNFISKLKIKTLETKVIAKNTNYCRSAIYKIDEGMMKMPPNVKEYLVEQIDQQIATLTELKEELQNVT